MNHNTSAVFITRDIPASTHYPADPSYTTLMEKSSDNHHYITTIQKMKRTQLDLFSPPSRQPLPPHAPSLVAANATRGLSAAERLMLPSDRAMKKVSQRAYQREHPNQRAPPTLSALVLTNDDLLNSNQQPMLIYDNHHATRRIIVLGACALAFVPAQDVPAAWDEISQQFPVSDKFDAFVTYFERTWVGRRNTNPIYAINKWNMRDRVLNDLLTTNNHVEGFHNKFSTLVGHRNPTVWTWLDAVRANQNLSFNALARWCSWSSVQRTCHRQTKTAKGCSQTVRNTVLV